MNDDRQASSLEIRPLRPAAERYDVAILGGGLAGLTLAIQLKRQRPDTTRGGAREARGPGPAGRVQGGRVDRRPPAPTTSPRWSGWRSTCEKDAADQVRAALLPPADGNRDITQARRVRRRSLPAARQLPDRSRPVRERARRPRPCARASTSCRAVASRTSSSATTCTRSSFTQMEAERHHQGPLGGRRRRPGEPPEAQARPGQGRRAHHQLRLVPARRRPRHRGLGTRTTRSGWARCPSPASASSAPTT